MYLRNRRKNLACYLENEVSSTFINKFFTIYPLRTATANRVALHLIPIYTLFILLSLTIGACVFECRFNKIVFTNQNNNFRYYEALLDVAITSSHFILKV